MASKWGRSDFNAELQLGSDFDSIFDRVSDWESYSGSDEAGVILNVDDRDPPSTPDLALISELLESVELNPSGKEAHVLLMQHYVMCGWHEAAKEEAHRILEIDHTAKEALKYLRDQRTPALGRDDITGNKKGKGKARDFMVDTQFKEKHGESRSPRQQSDTVSPWRANIFPITSISASLQELEDGYIELLEDAKLCLHDTKLLKDLEVSNYELQISNLEALAKGQVNSAIRVKSLESVKVVAEAIVADSKDGGRNGLNAAIKDLEDLVRWCRISADSTKSSSKGKEKSTGKDDKDSIREAMVGRVKALKALLPEKLQPIASLAMMHAEHEVLHRKYINNETTDFEPVSDIPRSKFWASEDGYAWDMEELARSITSGKGVMRNPLSKQMFTRADIRMIIQHPLGKGLQALQVEQSKLKRGVRPQTINEIDRLAKVLLADMSEDGKPSHLAVEVFVSYLETLPSSEQEAMNNLKVPARDSHTGIEFDATIGETVKDVEGNRICGHKAGDLLAQAVKYLNGQSMPTMKFVYQ